MKRITILILFMLLFSSCVWRVAIDEGEVGLRMNDGVQVSEVLEPGRHGPFWGWYAKVEQVNISAITHEWTDPDLVTKDKQPIGVTIGFTFARNPEKIREMRQRFRPETLNDEALLRLVLNRLPRVAKSSTAQFTIDEMIAARTILDNHIFENLSAELDEIGVVLLDVGVNNIAPSPSYLALLQRKADAQVEVEVAVEEGILAEENLIKEQLQTEVELELARRGNLINEELAKTFQTSPEYFELERLRLLGDVIGPSDTIYFTESVEQLMIMLTQSGVTPIVVPNQ